MRETLLKNRLIATTMLVSFASSICPGLSVAQESDSQDDRIEVIEDDQEARQEKVVITGSLIARSSYTSSSPIQVITAEVATLEGLVDTAALLQGSSLAAGSTQLNNTFQNFVTNGGIGTQTIDLRGCGDTRTLVLIDGKRPGPSGTRGEVAALDLNVVPQTVISRIEILKDGASTVYGSDAVCGVVNIITRDSIDGFELNLNTVLPEESGGEEYRLSAAYGFEIGSNMDFTLAAEYRLQAELDASDRDYLECGRDRIRDPVTLQSIDRLNQSATATDPRRACNNLYHNTAIDAFSGERLIPSPDGATIPTIYGGAVPGYRPRVGTGTNPDGTLYYEDILDAAFLDNADFFPQNENVALFASADLEISGFTWDTELLYNRRETEVEGWRQFFPLIGSASNPAGNNPVYAYLSDPTYSNRLNSLARPVLAFPTYDKITVDYYYLSSSLSGGFGDAIPDWSWKVDGTFSRGEGTYQGTEIRASKSSDWGIDGLADFTGDGEPDFVSPPTIDFFDPDILSGAAQDQLVAEIGGYQSGETQYEQTTLTAVTTGTLFTLPAGEVGAAFGVEYREFSIDDQPGALTQAGDVWASSTAGPTVGENTVLEMFGEISVPIFKGQPFAEEVEFSSSFRSFEYDLGGSDSIYKLGLNWQINPIFRARSSYGTSFRAPALFELFLQDQTGFLSQSSIDTCIDWGTSTNPNVRANCAAIGIPDNYAGGGSSALVTTSGGGNTLQPETSDTFTAGLIFTPTFIDLNIALDYYEIEIRDQIATLTGAQIVGGCYGSPGFPNDFCDLFERAPTDDAIAPNRIDNVQASTLNVDAQQQRGIDLEIRYQADLNFGELTIEGSVNWALERYIDVFGSDFNIGIEDRDFNGTVGYPSVVGDVSIRLDRGDWTYSWFTDFTGHQDDNRRFEVDLNDPQDYFGLDGLYDVNTEAEFRHGASLRWEGDTWSFTAGMRNIFDEEPPQVSDVLTVVGNTPLNATGYDFRGRRAFFNVSKSF